MSKKIKYLALFLLVNSLVLSQDIWSRDSLTNGFGGISDELAGQGIDLALSATQIYQHNAKGAESTHRRAGRLSGSYDLEFEADLERLLGIETAVLYMHAEGWWSKSQGIDLPSVGTAFGVNGDAGMRDAVVITEFWWQQSFMDDKLQLRIGKMDITGGFECSGCPVSFDQSMFAHDETTQFINSALVNNPTIPFPDYALGISMYYQPADSWYLGASAVDATNDHRETGFNTAFSDEDYYFYILETGITPRLDLGSGPLQGAYRVGIWNDPQPKAHSDAAGTYRDDIGVYVSCDQVLTRENNKMGDNQGLGIFARYGYAENNRNDITNFFSAGFQYQGLFEGRDDDVLGIGYARGYFSDKANITYTQDYESVLEMYYNIQAARWINITPSVQYVSNPGGDSGMTDAVIFTLRAQITF